MELRSEVAPAIAEGHKRHEWHKGRCFVGANLKVGKAIYAPTNLATPFTPQNPFATWGIYARAQTERNSNN